MNELGQADDYSRCAFAGWAIVETFGSPRFIGIWGLAHLRLLVLGFDQPDIAVTNPVSVILQLEWAGGNVRRWLAWLVPSRRALNGK